MILYLIGYFGTLSLSLESGVEFLLADWLGWHNNNLGRAWECHGLCGESPVVTFRAFSESGGIDVRPARTGPVTISLGICGDFV